MANKLISNLGLPKSIANIFAARNIITAKEALSLTEFELMELLDVGLAEVTSAVAHISEMVCPHYVNALMLLEQQIQNEHLAGHLPTRLKGLDDALCGGIPFGVVTELVGPAGIGKTQLHVAGMEKPTVIEVSKVGRMEFCLKLALLASLPACYGGLDGHVVYIDVESKFNSKRLIEIGSKSLPEVFYHEEMAKEVTGRILVLRPASLQEFTESLQQIKVSLIQHKVRLLIIDSLAALVSGEHEQSASRQHPLGWHISFIKSMAEFSRIPVVVTNQVRSHIYDEVCQFPFQVQGRGKSLGSPTRYDSHLVAALGIPWAHAVNIRLILESISGKRRMKIAKSPISPPLQFPYEITSSGISLLSDEGIELSGPDINTIHCQGHSDVIYFGKAH